MNNYNNRYGFDLLSVFMIFIALILNIFPVTRIFSFILLILSFYRAFSKKYYKRRQEYLTNHYLLIFLIFTLGAFIHWWKTVKIILMKSVIIK